MGAAPEAPTGFLTPWVLVRAHSQGDYDSLVSARAAYLDRIEGGICWDVLRSKAGLFRQLYLLTRHFLYPRGGSMDSFSNAHGLAAAAILLPALLLSADVDTKFHNAPVSAQAAKNPYAGEEEAAQSGQKLYARNCVSCHGKTGNGTGKTPSLVSGRLDSVAPGEVFWFITRGDKENGMPAWASLPAKQRWQIVTYVKSMGTSQGTAESSREASALPPPDMNPSKLNALPPP